MYFSLGYQTDDTLTLEYQNVQMQRVIAISFLLTFFIHQQVVRDSILGIGTDEDSLNRGIVTRAEIDLLKVRFEYANMYKSSLDDDVIGDTSGNYKDFLMTLLGKGPKGD